MGRLSNASNADGSSERASGPRENINTSRAPPEISAVHTSSSASTAYRPKGIGFPAAIAGYQTYTRIGRGYVAVPLFAATYLERSCSANSLNPTGYAPGSRPRDSRRCVIIVAGCDSNTNSMTTAVRISRARFLRTAPSCFATCLLERKAVLRRWWVELFHYDAPAS